MANSAGQPQKTTGSLSLNGYPWRVYSLKEVIQLVMDEVNPIKVTLIRG
jgi:hypothetical protein